jgi:NADH-quinone oxidoreductase subunit J
MEGPQVIWDAAFVTAIAAVVVGAMGIVVAKKAFYILLGLVTSALGVASILALIGYTYLSAFHVIVYIGTSITLIAIVMMLLGRHIEPQPWKPERLLLAIAAAFILQAPVFMYATIGSPSFKATISEVSRQLFECWYCTILIVVTLATVIIEAIAIARRPVSK